MFYEQLPCFHVATDPTDGKPVGRSVFYCCDDHPDMMTSDVATTEVVSLPYARSLHSALCPGRLLSISGHIPSTAKTFTVALTCGSDANADVALQLDVHLFPGSYVARNSRLGGKWGRKESAMGQRNRFRRDTDVHVDILTQRTAFYVSVNARHFVKYKHRLRTSQIDTLRIDGDLHVRNITHGVAASYPAVCAENPLPYDAVIRANDEDITTKDEGVRTDDAVVGSNNNIAMTDNEVVRTKDEGVGADRVEAKIAVPFVGKLADGHLASGKELVVEGKVELLPCMLYVRLQQGQQHWPPPDVALAIHARYMETASGEPELGLRSRADAVWGVETLVPQYPFKPGTRFRLTVSLVGDAFQIHVDGKLLANVKHALPPEKMALIDTLVIKGCVFIHKIYFNHQSSVVLL